MGSVMPGTARLVAAVSGSPGSLGVLRYALAVARRDNVLLVAPLAWVPPGGDLAERRYPSAVLRKAWADAARHRLAEAFGAACGGVPADLDVQLTVIRGETGPVLVEPRAHPGTCW